MNLNEPVYASITYDLDFAEDGDDEEVSQLRFNKLQYKLRRIQRHRKRTSGFLEGTDRQDVELVYEGRRISCKMKVDDYYFVGYQKVIPGSLLWEAYTTPETQCLQDSSSLGFTLNYSGGVPKRKLGIHALREAFNTLWYQTPDDDDEIFPTTDLEKAFQCIAVNMCEAARFQPIFMYVYDHIYVEKLVPDWMQLLVNQWSNYSGVARLPQPTRFRIPEELQQRDLDDYTNYEFPRILDPRAVTAAPYFARKLIRVLHIL